MMETLFPFTAAVTTELRDESPFIASTIACAVVAASVLYFAVTDVPLMLTENSSARYAWVVATVALATKSPGVTAGLVTPAEPTRVASVAKPVSLQSASIETSFEVVPALIAVKKFPPGNFTTSPAAAGVAALIVEPSPHTLFANA